MAGSMHDHRLDDDGVRRAARRLLAAAAGDGELSPAFAARTAARAVAAPAAPAITAVGAAAWRLLPALATLVLAVAAWTGYESVRLAASEEAALAQAIDRDSGGAVMAMILLGGAAPTATGSGR
jgi:hypothetical protein